MAQKGNPLTGYSEYQVKSIWVPKLFRSIFKPPIDRSRAL